MRSDCSSPGRSLPIPALLIPSALTPTPERNSAAFITERILPLPWVVYVGVFVYFAGHAAQLDEQTLKMILGNKRLSAASTTGIKWAAVVKLAVTVLQFLVFVMLASGPYLAIDLNSNSSSVHDYKSKTTIQPAGAKFKVTIDINSR